MAASIESGNSASTADLATTKTGTATVSMGNTTGTFTVPVNDDSTDEDDQTFTVTLSDVWSNAQLAADPTAEGTIEDDDNPPTLTVADLRHDENTLLANVTVSLSEVSEKRVNFRLRQVDRTGDTASDADWNPRPAVFISFSAGTMSEESAAVSVVNDTLDEDDETLTVEAYGLDNATGSAADREATITIVDDVEFVVTLSAVSGRDVMVDYATSVATGDDAVSDTDFTSTSGTLTIAAADDTATGTIEVPTAEDTTVESSETFTLTISSPDNATLTTDTTATGTINNRATTAAEPTNFEAAVGNAQVVLSWDPPASDSGVTRHEYRFKTGTGSYPAMWEQIANSGVGGTNEDGFTVTSLTNEVLHTFQLRAVNAQGESAAAESDPVTPTPGICDRTQQVHELIVYYLEDSYGVERTCEEVNVADLERFTIALEMASENIGSLKSGDFAGLTNLNTLVLASNSFTTLPADVFSGLTSLRALVLDSGELSSIDARAFSGLTALEGIRLEGNDLDSLPGTVFSGLTSLTTLTLTNNDLTSLPAGVFSGLSALTTLSLSRNDLSSLPAGVFSGLSALTILTLKDNDLNSLPDGLFSGLTALTILRLDDNPNTDDKLPLTVTLEKVGADRVRAKVPAGAPFAVDIPVTPAAVTVDVDLSTQPTRPEFHQGYVFARAAVLAWTPPAPDSGFTHHQYRYRTDGDFGDWTDIPDSGLGEANGSRYTVTGLDNAVEHTFELRAGDAGAGKSDAATVRVTPEGPPRITLVAVTSGPGLDNETTYGVGEEIRISVTFDQPVEVEGDPQFGFSLGNSDRLAEYDSGGGMATLVFVYVVRGDDDDDGVPDDHDGDGISIGGDALRLDGAHRIGNGAGDGPACTRTRRSPTRTRTSTTARGSTRRRIRSTPTRATSTPTRPTAIRPGCCPASTSTTRRRTRT